MTRTLNKLSSRWLFVIWTSILTIGLVAALYGVQENSNSDAADSKKSDDALSLAFCHSLSDNNQAIRDVLSILSIDQQTTSDMTPSKIESIRIANQKRKGYRAIAEGLFPVPVCVDGYKAVSKYESLLPLLSLAPNGSTTTTGTTVPGG